MQQLVTIVAVERERERERESYILQKQTKNNLIKKIRVEAYSTLKEVYKKRKALCN